MMHTPVNFREKWRERRRRMNLRRLPLLIMAAIGVVALVVWMAERRLPQLGAVAWSQGDGSDGAAHLGLGSGVLAVVWETGKVQAYNAATGQPLWREPFRRSHELSGEPAVGPDCVVFGSTDCNVWCLDLKTGVDRWHYTTRAIVRSTPLIVGDRVLVGADDGRLYALALKDGRYLWAFPFFEQADRRPIIGGPALSGQAAVCGSCDRTALGLDLATGRFLWRRRIGSPIIARTTADRDKVYVAAESGTAACLRAATGQIVWVFRAPSLIRSPILVSDGRAYVVGSDRVLSCLNAETGVVLWQRTIRARPTTPAGAQDRRIYLGMSDGTVEALSPETGRTLWHWRADAKLLGGLLTDPAHVYCTTNQGRVFAVRLSGS
jgi:outer membrane protein assembly factor BamB